MTRTTRGHSTIQRRSGQIHEDAELGIPDRGHIVEALNRVLADENVVYIKTKNYHWNVESSHFYGLHKLLEEQYETLDKIVDEVAERARALGGRALGSMNEFLGAATLEESEEQVLSWQDMIGHLVDDHEAMSRNLRPAMELCDKQHDEGTKDVFIKILRHHEKMAWMLRSLLADGAR